MKQTDDTKQAYIDYLEAVISNMQQHNAAHGYDLAKHTYCEKCFRTISPYPLHADRPKLMHSFLRGFVVGLGILIIFGIVALVIVAILY